MLKIELVISCYEHFLIHLHLTNAMLQQISFENCGNINVSSDDTTITIKSNCPIKLQHSERWMSVLPDTRKQTTDDIIENYLENSSGCTVAGGNYGILHDCYTREITKNGQIYLYIYCPSKYTCEVVKPPTIQPGSRQITINGVSYTQASTGLLELGSLLSNGSAFVGAGTSTVSCSNHNATLNGNKLVITTNIASERVAISQTKFMPFDEKTKTTKIITIDKRLFKKVHCQASNVTFIGDNIFYKDLVIANVNGYFTFLNTPELNQVLVSTNTGGQIDFNNMRINSLSITSVTKTETNVIKNFVLLVGGFIHADGKCDVIGKISNVPVNGQFPSFVTYADTICNIQIIECCI